MKQHIKLQDVVEANNLLMSMGAQDQLSVIASAAIERSLELQHRIDRAVRYAEESHTSSLHARQILRILDGSITIDDENNEVIPEPVINQGTLDAAVFDAAYPRLVQRPPLEAPPAKRSHHAKKEGGLGDRNTAERKAFRDWVAQQGIELPLNQTVPQQLINEFDEATDGLYRPKPRKPYTYSGKGPRGKLKPGHGLSGRTAEERLHIRNWLTEQGYDVNPTGRIPQRYLTHYDQAMEALKQLQAENRRKQQEARSGQEQEPEQDDHAQGA
jgi:hypothetical protein